MIDIEELHDSPHNFFRMESVDSFADIILAQGGVKENLIVTPREEGGYEIISGHRRSSAIRLLIERGENISHLLPCLVQVYADEQAKIMDLICENIGTRQLNDQELWQSYEQMNQVMQDQKSVIGRKFGRIREKLAEKLGISSSQVSKLQHIQNSAVPEVQEAISDGTLSINTANEIAKLKPEMQQELMKEDAVTPKKIRDAKKKVDTPVNVVQKSNADADSGTKVDTPVNLAQKSDTGTDSGTKVDTPVNLAQKSDTGTDSDAKVDTPVTLQPAAKDMLHYAMKPQAERDCIFDSGCFNDIALGYLTLTLKEMDMDEKTIRNAQRIMNGLFELSKAAEARTAYQES